MKKNPPLFDNTGRTALITGGAGLLGIEHAKAMLSTNADVIITDLNKDNLIKVSESLAKSFSKSKIKTFIMDVSSESSVSKVSEEISDLGVRVDILINNAAINPGANSLQGSTRVTRLENFSLEQWNLEMSVGITGAFLCSKVFGSIMAVDGLGGVILNIASDLSVIAPDQALYRQDGLVDELQAVKPVTYSVIKTGLIGLTRYLSSYWAHKAVRCNALSPGGVYDGQSDEFVNRLQNIIPMGRMATKNEYVGAIQFLCSDASAYMNGQNIVIDGGRSVI
ncbi:SDR family oxidoreductase [Planktomarina temperata]|nr:SDR family oxidoreductase [Planktomarina temperata]